MWPTQFVKLIMEEFRALTSAVLAANVVNFIHEDVVLDHRIKRLAIEVL